MEVTEIRKMIAEEVAKYSDEYLSVEEAMVLLRSTSKKNFYQQSKRFTRYKPLGRILFKKSELIAHIESHKIDPLPETTIQLNTQRPQRIVFTQKKGHKK